MWERTDLDSDLTILPLVLHIWRKVPCILLGLGVDEGTEDLGLSGDRDKLKRSCLFRCCPQGNRSQLPMDSSSLHKRFPEGEAESRPTDGQLRSPLLASPPSLQGDLVSYGSPRAPALEASGKRRCIRGNSWAKGKPGPLGLAINLEASPEVVHQKRERGKPQGHRTPGLMPGLQQASTAQRGVTPFSYSPSVPPEGTQDFSTLKGSGHRVQTRCRANGPLDRLPPEHALGVLTPLPHTSVSADARMCRAHPPTTGFRTQSSVGPGIPTAARWLPSTLHLKRGLLGALSAQHLMASVHCLAHLREGRACALGGTGQALQPGRRATPDSGSLPGSPWVRGWPLPLAHLSSHFNRQHPLHRVLRDLVQNRGSVTTREAWTQEVPPGKALQRGLEGGV